MKEQWRTARQLLGYYPRVLHLIWAASPRYAFWAILLSSLSALATPARIWLTQMIIDRVLVLIKAQVPGLSIAWSGLLWPVGALVGALILGEVGQRVANAVEEILRFRVEHHARYLLLQKAAQLDIAFYESSEFFDQLDRAHNELARTMNLAKVTIDSIGQVLSLTATLGLVTRLHPLAGPLMVLVSVPQLIVSGQYAVTFFSLLNRNTPARRMADYLSNLLASRDAVKEVRLFGLQQRFLAHFRHYWQTFFVETQALIFARERKSSIYLIFSALGAGAVWVLAIVQAVLGQITIGELTLAIQAVERVRADLGGLFLRGGIFYENMLFVGNFFALLDLAPTAVEGALTRSGQETLEPPRSPPLDAQGIEFCNVSFHYPGSDHLILRNLSFVIRPGTNVALVGDNGAGKTTLVKLLARYYDPTAGAILWNGQDLRDYDPTELQRTIGVIFQDFVRYQLTVQENIGFGQLDQLDDMTQVQQAAAKGGAVPTIETLPNGYATMLGKTFENSVELSGGEWQKLALSRAFMRDAHLLILDEPTAALDAKAEYDVYKRFAELTANKTTLFISHRFSTVRMAQKILVLGNGQLIEEGTHEELMALGGQYAEMFTLQADRYR